MQHGVDVNYQDHRGWTALMVAAHRGHTEMVYVLLKDGKADTTLTDSYGKKAIDRAHSSHISYLIASASIENRMKDISTNLNINEYSPNRRGSADVRSQSRDGGVTTTTINEDRTPNSNQKSQKTLKSILMTSGKKKSQSPGR